MQITPFKFGWNSFKSSNFSKFQIYSIHALYPILLKIDLQKIIFTWKKSIKVIKIFDRFFYIRIFFSIYLFSLINYILNGKFLKQNMTKSLN